MSYDDFFFFHCLMQGHKGIRGERGPDGLKGVPGNKGEKGKNVSRNLPGGSWMV